MSGPQQPRGPGHERGLAAPTDPRLPGLTENEVRAIVRRLLVTEGVMRMPVGAVYTNITGVNPATELGFGTWTAFAPGRVLVGYSGVAPYDVAEANIGNATHRHTYSDLPQHGHNLSLVNSLHRHTVGISTGALTTPGNVSLQGSNDAVDEQFNSEFAATAVTGTADNAGVASPETNATANLPEAVVVYFWKRTA